MRKTTLLLAFCLAVPLSAAPAMKTKTQAAPVPQVAATASPTPEEWKKQVVASLNLTQGAFDNWKQGGTNFISWQAALNGRLEQDNVSVNWVNRVKLEYGLTYVDGQGTKKSADNLELESVYSWKTWPQVFPFVSILAKTQFDWGFDHTPTPAVQTSAFMDPGYLTQMAGLKWVPSPEFNTRLGFALKETVTDQFSALYGVDPATGIPERFLVQAGLGSVTELNLKLTGSSSFGSKLDLFWNGRELEGTVIQWDNLFSVSLDKVLSVNFEADFRMDPAVYPFWQIKETLGIGFAYTLL